MTFGLLAGMFLFVLAAVSVAGYVFVLRPSKAEGDEVQIPQAISLNQRDLPAAQAAFADTFRVLGESLPLPGDREALRRQLIDGGLSLARVRRYFPGHQSRLRRPVRSGRHLGGAGQRHRSLRR